MLTTIKIESIYDLISLIVLFLNFYSIFSFQFELLVFNGLALIVHQYIKELTFGLYPSIFKDQMVLLIVMYLIVAVFQVMNQVFLQDI